MVIASDCADQPKGGASTPRSTGENLRAPLVFSICIFLLSAVLSAYAYLGCLIYGPPWNPPIRSDGYGYYAYLPALFIDHDLSMKTPKAFRGTVVGDKPLPYEWDGISMYAPTGKYLDKYTIGTAILELPFFGAALVSAKLLGFPANGYSLPFQVAIQLSGMTYMAAGALLLFLYLSARFDMRICLLTTAAAVLGTSVIHYGTLASSLSHSFSFFLFALLLNCAELYRTHGLHTGRNLGRSAYMGAVVGLITLVRITNVIGAIVPLAFAWERFARGKSTRSLLLEIGCGVLAFVMILLPQLVYWYAVTGHIFINSYLGEGFDWLSPQIIPFLFSLRRGLFVWTPIAFFAIAGLPLLYRNDRFLAAAIGLVLMADIYICSSWWSWWFGGGFGCRPLTDLVPLLAVPLACCLDWMALRLNRAVPVCVVSCAVLLNLFLMLSIWRGLLPWDNVHLTDFTQLPGKWELALR